MWKATGGYRTYSIPGKAAALVPEFAVEAPSNDDFYCIIKYTRVFLRYLHGVHSIQAAKVVWDFRISDLVKKNPMELMLNPCGEFR